MTLAMRIRPQKAIASPCDYIAFLDSCIKSKSLFEGKLIHQTLIKGRDFNNTQIAFGNKVRFFDGITSIIHEKLTHLYIACDDLKHARISFDASSQKPKNVIVWNQLIRAYAWNGPFEESIDLYYKMVEIGVKPSKFTFPFVLKACSSIRAIEEGKEIHGHAKSLNLDCDVYVATALIDLYAKCGCLLEAMKVFDEMPQRDVVAWNSMIAGFSLDGEFCYQAIELFVKMQEHVRPNSSSIVAVLPSVGQANELRHGKELHGFCLRRGYSEDVVVGTGLLDMYGKCRYIGYARRIFDMMGVVKNEVSWSAITSAYVACDCMTEALKLFNQMMMLQDDEMAIPTLASVVRACAKLTDLSKGRCLHCYITKLGFLSDLRIGNTLLSLYAKCGVIDEAMSLFDEMHMKDAVSFSAIISGCVQNGYAEDVLVLFHKMLVAGIEPDASTMVGILPACSHLSALQHGSCGHGYTIVRGFTTDTSVCNALIDMYAKCGKIGRAREVFNRMQKRDIVSWNTMIIAYGIHGLGTKAISLFDILLKEGLKPDDVTFICLLSACSHSGLVAEGKQWFHAMSRRFDIAPRMEHYICMVDLLARAGLFGEVHRFIEEMPFEPDVRIYGAVLAACKVHKNVKFGEEASRKIRRLGHESTGNFVLLSNMYSSIGRYDDAAEVRTTQKNQGFKKVPGCSWIEVSGVVHAFIGGDRSHPLWVQISNKLSELLVEMKKLGYDAESSYVLQDVEEEEKEGILLYHSEKLAIAFGILSLSPKKPILVTKNLRICNDCHTAIKFISVVTKRDITVRDASRFHHFRDGLCNCGDFW